MMEHDARAPDQLPPQYTRLLEDFTAGSRTALARTISVVEDARPGFQAILSALHPRIGRAHRLGITGPPGAGKSTLTAALIAAFRAHGERVAVIAVDPTSPFTGGALLGDRIRMNDAARDRDVFIRSMATRGSLGGLATTTGEVADTLDAFGFDRIIIETVGVGQSELDIAATADSTVVVLVPESGDSIQAMKAGLMEIADLFVVNKADRPGAERLAREIELMLHLRHGNTLRNVPAHHGVDTTRIAARHAPAKANVPVNANVNEPAHANAPANANVSEPVNENEHEPVPVWPIPVLLTIAETGDGVPRLVETLEQHRSWLVGSGELSRRRRARLADRVRDAVARSLARTAWHERGGEELLAGALDGMEAGTLTPYEVAARIVRAVAG